MIICCVLNGNKYPDSLVYNLKKMVSEFYSETHHFICVTDKNIPGVKCIEPGVKGEVLKGWFQKLLLFKLFDQPFIYLDLDVLITGDITYLNQYALNCDLAMPGVFTPGKKGYQSSVFCSNGSFSAPFEDFDFSLLDASFSKTAPFGVYGVKRIRGDQEYLTEYYDKCITRIKNGIYSYKIHCKNNLPLDAKVVCFHGKPDYFEAKAPWVADYIESHFNI